jgi:hypothetical protein
MRIVFVVLTLLSSVSALADAAQPSSPNAYGPGINRDVTGRPFTNQPLSGNGAAGPLSKLGATAEMQGKRVASACESGHMVEEVMSDGEIVKLEDGSLWEVSGGDEITSALWLPTDDIVVCDGKLINTDDNESVEAERIR